MKLFLDEKNLSTKGFGLIANASTHPDEAELAARDGKNFAMYLPLKVTLLIQPIDQNTLKSTKLHYINSLLANAKDDIEQENEYNEEYARGTGENETKLSSWNYQQISTVA